MIIVLCRCDRLRIAVVAGVGDRYLLECASAAEQVISMGVNNASCSQFPSVRQRL
jgi:hypothetical protein